jgi:hypothetical protein
MNKIYGIIGDKKARGVYKGLIIIRMEEHNLLDGFILKYWKYGNTDDGKIRIGKYKKMYYEYEGNNNMRLEYKESKNFL